MTRVVLTGVAGRSLSRVTWEIPAGVVALVDSPGACASEIAGLVAGIARPRHGTVRIDGADPFRTPLLRRHVASLLEEEPELEGRTVGDAVSLALSLRGCERPAGAVLAEHGLESWSLRRPSGLSPMDRRRLALALALAMEAPRVVVLVEPLPLSASRVALALALAERARGGASILCITASVRAGVDLGGRVFALRAGAVAPVEEPWASVPARAELVVHTGDPSALVRALAAEPAVVVVSVGARVPTELVVRGADASLVSLAVLRAAKAAGVTVSSSRIRVGEPEAPKGTFAPLLEASS